jgi:outer membrane receptor protein involved in Fe transport
MGSPVRGVGRQKGASAGRAVKPRLLPWSQREFFPASAGSPPMAAGLRARVYAAVTTRPRVRMAHRSAFRLTLLLAASLPALLCGPALAQTAPQPPPPDQASPLPALTAPGPGGTPQQVEQVTVVGTSPLLGSGVDRNLVPVQTQVLSSAQIARQGAPDVLQALNTEVAGINLDSASGNQYQPSIFYNGFEVSPLQGTSQGIAVYVNGVRFNQAFGDTVNWDLIPDVAINKINVEGANPLFGLNALGGSFNVAMKDGFTYQGGEADISGGAFGQIQGDIQYGMQSGDQAFYAAGSVVHQDGWRDLQSTDIQNMYADWGIRHDGTEIHLSLSAANSVINGPGTAPIELLNADSAAQFTAPNGIDNRNIQASARANFQINDVLSVQAQVYYSYFLQHVVNGNSANDYPCDDGSGLLCQGPGQYSTTVGGRLIPAYLGNSPFAYSELDLQTTNTNSYGGAGQFTDTGELFGLKNHFVTGASFDGAQTGFGAAGYIGGLTPDSRIFVGPGVLIDEPGNNVPVRVDISDSYAGGFASDTLNVTEALALTASGRFNFAEIDLRDQNGGDLSGNHAYARFNPGAGVTYNVAPWLTAYGGYSESNRAPTPAELSCAGPNDSCSLANFFVGDPDLKQVVARTFDAGLRGHIELPNDAALSYDADLFHTDSNDDIIFVNSVTLNRAYFANVGLTRRQGFSGRLDYNSDPVNAYIAYTYTDATVQTGYVEAAGSNPDADANGNITIKPGDALPGIPRTTLKLGFDSPLTAKWRIGADGLYQSGQYLIGDEANLTPRLPGFFTVNAHTSYDFTPRVQLFVNVQNLFDKRYFTFGTFSPTNSVYLTQDPGAANPRSYSLAAPIGFFGGVRVKF